MKTNLTISLIGAVLLMTVPIVSMAASSSHSITGSRQVMNVSTLVSSEFTTDGQNIVKKKTGPCKSTASYASLSAVGGQIQTIPDDGRGFTKGSRFTIGNKTSGTPVMSQVEGEENEPEYHDVTFRFNLDMEEYRIENIMIFDPETRDCAWGWIKGEDPECVFGAVSGTFCAYVKIHHKMNLEDSQIYLIKENIVVDEDLVVEFDPNEATNYQRFDQYTHDGEVIQFSAYREVDEESNSELVEQGNVEDVTISFAISYEGYGDIVTYMDMMGGNEIDVEGNIIRTEHLYDFRINDVSDKVKFTQARISRDTKGNIDVLKFEDINVHGSNIFSNDPSTFVHFDGTLDYAQHFDAMPAMSGISIVRLENGVPVGITSSLSSLSNSQYYIGKTTEGIDDGFALLAIPTRGEFRSMEDWQPLQCYSTPLQNNGDGKLQCVVYPYSSDPVYCPYLNTKDGSLGIRMSAFSYSLDQLADAAFHNVPVQVSQSNLLYENAPEYFLPQFSWNYIGNNGEQDMVNVQLCEAVMKRNGEVIVSNVDEMMDLWYSDYEQEFANINGSYELTTCLKLSFDGIEACNTTVTTYEVAPGADTQSPTIQMLQLRKEDETVTTRFKEGDVVNLLVAGGDYNYIMTEDWIDWFDYIPAPIKVEYSAYNANEWQELEVKANEDLFYLPGFGDTYQGTISDLPVSQNNWYDLRLTVVDAAGNSQQQTLTAAFRVDNATSISTLKPVSEHVAYDVYGRKSTSGKGLLICNGKIITVK